MVLYGGVSTEHEVAIISALQVMSALKEAGHEVVPVYISKKGEWFWGDERFLKPEFYKNLNEIRTLGKKVEMGAGSGGKILMKKMAWWQETDKKIDVVFPVFHGKNGEDGAVQGWLNLVNLPYVGCPLLASAVAMDKSISKMAATSIGLRVAEEVLVVKSDWERDRKVILEKIKKLGKSVFVKPSGGGSTIAVGRADNQKDTERLLEVALVYDDRVVVEKEIERPIEVNISILGNNPYEVSITEQPIASGKVLSFEDKYVRGSKGGKSQGMAGSQRLMPAGVSEKIIIEIEEAAKSFFATIGGRGIARIDFMVDKGGVVYFNEINPMPGSIAFYLWEKRGVKIGDLVDRLVNLAIEDWLGRQKLVTTFESNILAGYAGSSGTKGKI